MGAVPARSPTHLTTAGAWPRGYDVNRVRPRSGANPDSKVTLGAGYVGGLAFSEPAARSRVFRAILMEAASTICPPTLTAPLPAALALS